MREDDPDKFYVLNDEMNQHLQGMIDSKANTSHVYLKLQNII